MDYLVVDNHEIPYIITKKKNKNTYFYFRNEGYIQINLSRYQSKKVVLNYLKNNSAKFIKKLNDSTTPTIDSSKEFLYLGSVFQISIEKQDYLCLDPESDIVHTPTSDLNSPVIINFYKTQMISIINRLVLKYIENPYVDISNVTYKTRYTTSRHGSCNAMKRRINLNLNLVKYDEKFIEYVFLHEITHLKHQNHGPDFYELFEKLCPNYKEIRKEFKKIYR
jgi:predicted metal-dependent hydrolase